MEQAPTRQAYAGRIIRVEVQSRPEGEYDIVRHPGSAAVVPITPEGDVLLVRQLRPALGESLVEVPAGLLDQREEDALSCAARELFEETGYRHASIEFLGGCFPSPGYTDEYVHLFVATTRADPEGPPEEGVEVLRQPFDQMVAAARAGRIRDAKTALALFLADARGHGR
ncbi:MAG TPA: NUDIX hydrolase [Actinomycetota bacterium]|nr:NUDIX hydrolase [Actinomycetota bacterium]